MAIWGQRAGCRAKNIPARGPLAILNSGAIRTDIGVALALLPGLRMSPTMSNPRSRLPYILPWLGMALAAILLIHLAKML
jgi:hypothetical protein